MIDYFGILIVFFLSVIICIVLVVLSLVLAVQDFEKVFGFNFLYDIRQSFQFFFGSLVSDFRLGFYLGLLSNGYFLSSFNFISVL